MSDYRGIAALTWALRNHLQDAVTASLQGVQVQVRIGAPRADWAAEKNPTINIHLYQVGPHPDLRNTELPLRRRDGSAERGARLPLQLNYILSFFGEAVEWGAKSRFMPELLLGLVACSLHTQPRPSPGDVPGSDDEVFGRTGLRDEIDLVTFTPVVLDPEELAKLWGLFPGVSYPPSLVYRASTLMLEPDIDVTVAPPVTDVGVGSDPHLPPIIDAIDPQVIAFRHEAMVALTGRRLRAKETRIRFGEHEVTPEDVAPQLIRTRLPSSVKAGVNLVRVAHTVDMGSGGERWLESNPVALVIQPRLVASRVDFDELVVETQPDLRLEQKVRLLLNPVRSDEGESRRGYALPLSRRGGASELRFGLNIGHDPLDQTQQIRVAPGAYLARVEVDDVSSAIETSRDPTRIVGPTVVIE